MIPKKIFTSFKPNLGECEECRRTIEEWKSLNESFEVLYFSDEEVGQFFKDYEPGRMAYDILNNGTSIADFFRICYIHAEGGIWVDFDMAPFSLLNHIKESYLENENLFFDLGHKNISYMLISGAVKSNLFQKAVEQIAENIFSIKDQIYGKNIYPSKVGSGSDLDITGPHAFQNFISEEFGMRIFDGNFPGDNYKRHSSSDMNFFYTPVYGLTKKTEAYKQLQQKHQLKYWRDHLKRESA